MTRAKDSTKRRKSDGNATKPADRAGTLILTCPEDQTEAENFAAIIVEGIGMNAAATYETSRQAGLQTADLTEIMVAITKQADRVAAGNLDGLEGILVAQSITLNAVFTRLAHFAGRQTGLDVIDRTMRLALRAQGHCRATIETVALIKNPQQAVFAKQANIANGPQQVNNVAVRVEGDPSRAGNPESVPNELLEAHGERVDTGAASGAGARDSTLAPVGPLDRTKNDQREGARVAKCIQRRPAGQGPRVLSRPTRPDGRHGV
jgi:hypothetical protein